MHTAPALTQEDLVRDLLRPRRRIVGMSAILLPFTDDGGIDWDGFTGHVLRTARAGLTPAVNMDTGYAHLIDEPTRQAVLRRTRDALGGGEFVAGAFVGDQPGDAWNADAYRREMAAIQEHDGTPIVFQSHGLTGQHSEAVVESYAQLGRDCPRFLAFELGRMFAPFGKIYDLDTYAGLMDVPQCQGAKHSSLSRELEWQRLQLRNERRPDFRVLTGNDLAIDMVMYGSDLGFLVFRPPVPAYKHSAAQFLRLRGWIATDRTHPRSPERPASDAAILRDIAERLETLP